MSGRVRLIWKDLKVGMTVPWNVYDLEGRKLLGKGQVVRSRQMIEEMCQFILYHDLPDTEHHKQKSYQGKLNVFDKTGDYIHRIEKIYNELEEANPECSEKISRLAKDIVNLCGREPDAILAVVHLPHDYPYSLFHPLQCAYLASLIARRAGFTDDECHELATAAVLANVGMRYTQETLANQPDPPRPEQLKIIRQHPRKGIEMLHAIGFGDERVLNIILEHHERCDGSGYPNGFKRDEICRGALVLAVADRYGAMVSGRKYRDPLPIKEALQSFFMDKGRHFEAEFALLMIKELTVYPPGSFVKLTNGEMAVVVYRGKMSPMEPLLKSIAGADGKPYANPLVRDLSIHAFEIAAICPCRSGIQLNYDKLWGYVR